MGYCTSGAPEGGSPAAVRSRAPSLTGKIWGDPAHKMPPGRLDQYEYSLVGLWGGGIDVMASPLWEAENSGKRGTTSYAILVIPPRGPCFSLQRSGVSMSQCRSTSCALNNGSCQTRTFDFTVLLGTGKRIESIIRKRVEEDPVYLQAMVPPCADRRAPASPRSRANLMYAARFPFSRETSRISHRTSRSHGHWHPKVR